MNITIESQQSKPYHVLIHKNTYDKANTYLTALAANKSAAGRYVAQQLDDPSVTTAEFLETVINTKKPQIFAETAVFGDGSDWNQTELALLGDIAIAVPVIVYDNGLHQHPVIHAQPFSATLLYVPGALLRNGQGHTPADWEAIVTDGQIDAQKFYALYERRLLPSFLYANEMAQSHNKQAFITMPGLGCGQFAGKFQGQLGAELARMLTRFLHQHHASLPHIKAVYYDPYQECANNRSEIGHLSFMERPLTHGNQNKPQLCPPTTYEEDGDEFSNCDLFSFVAWDHVSWPGNDFYIGSRATDDGVKAAATNSMAIMTGIEGAYNAPTYTYDPPAAYRNWNEVVQKKHIRIEVGKGNLSVLPPPERMYR